MLVDNQKLKSLLSLTFHATGIFFTSWFLAIFLFAVYVATSNRWDDWANPETFLGVLAEQNLLLATVTLWPTPILTLMTVVTFAAVSLRKSQPQLLSKPLTVLFTVLIFAASAVISTAVFYLPSGPSYGSGELLIISVVVLVGGMYSLGWLVWHFTHRVWSEYFRERRSKRASLAEHQQIVTQEQTGQAQNLQAPARSEKARWLTWSLLARGAAILSLSWILYSTVSALAFSVLPLPQVEWGDPFYPSVWLATDWVQVTFTIGPLFLGGLVFSTWLATLMPKSKDASARPKLNLILITAFALYWIMTVSSSIWSRNFELLAIANYATIFFFSITWYLLGALLFAGMNRWFYLAKSRRLKRSIGQPAAVE